MLQVNIFTRMNTQKHDTHVQALNALLQVPFEWKYEPRDFNMLIRWGFWNSGSPSELGEFAFQTRVLGEMGWLGWNLASILIHGPIGLVDHYEEVCK